MPRRRSSPNQTRLAPTPPVWIVMRRDLSSTVVVQGEPSLFGAMVVEAETGLVLGTTMAADATKALDDTFSAALTKPPGIAPMGPPTLVLCPPGLHDEVADALRRLLTTDELPPISEIEPWPDAEEIFDMLLGHLLGRVPADDPPQADDWSAAITAAHQLRSLVPWDRWDESVALDVELTATGAVTRLRASVIGAAGEQRGLVLFPGWAWPKGFGGHGNAGNGRQPRPPDGTLVVFFDPPDDLPADLAAKARRYGWPADDDLLPLFAVLAGGRPVEPDRQQLRQLTVAATAVAAHDRRGPIAVGPSSATAGSVTLAGGEQVAYSVTVNPPSAPATATATATATAAAAGEPTIDVLLQAFLDEQHRRLAPKTVRAYEDVVQLLLACLNSYGYQSLDDDERQRWEKAFEHDDDAFVHLFGADKIVDNLDEFLGYFMVRKVVAGPGLLRSAGTVTKKLVRWLADLQQIAPAAARTATARAGQAAHDLPAADKLSQLLWDHAQGTADDLPELTDASVEEGLFTIERVEPHRLWLEGGRGPVTVPGAASDLAQPGWALSATLVHQAEQWYLVEVGTVYP